MKTKLICPDEFKITEIDYENDFTCEYKVKREHNIISYIFKYKGQKVYYISKEDIRKYVFMSTSDFVRERPVFENQIPNSKTGIKFLEEFNGFSDLYTITPFITPDCIYNIVGNNYVPTFDYFSLSELLSTGKSLLYDSEQIIEKINSTDWIFTKVDKFTILNDNDILDNIHIQYMMPISKNEELMDLYITDMWEDRDLSKKFIELLMN